jgi:PadR family transcriptional regulator, regulatory protein PadR
MGKKTDVWQGTLALMALRTLETIGPLHAYGIARRIEQTSGGDPTTIAKQNTIV